MFNFQSFNQPETKILFSFSFQISAKFKISHFKIQLIAKSILVAISRELNPVIIPRSLPDKIKNTCYLLFIIKQSNEISKTCP